jgi:hypothetical protein
MSAAALKSSLALWRNRWRRRRKREIAYAERAAREQTRDGRVSVATARKREVWQARRQEASRVITRRRKQIKAASRTKRPKIVRLGVTTRSVFGSNGRVWRATTHYAASPRARNLTEGLRMARGFHAFHAGKGWGGLSYNLLIPDSGEIILGRPVGSKAAGVAGQNSGNVHLNFFCTAGHAPTIEQERTYRWWLAHGHTAAMPASHRLPRPARTLTIKGHRDWPSQSTGCPGSFSPANLSK